MKLQIHQLRELVCPYCYAKVDGAQCRPMTETKCGQCGTIVKVPGVFSNYLLYTRLETDPLTSVFSAFDNTLERSVALRLLDPDGEAAISDALLESAGKIAAITQINVSKVHLVGEFDGVQYIEEELLLGGSLQELIDMDQRISELEALEILRDVASGLDAAHEKQIPHLNVSPNNIRFDGHGIPKIASFANHRLYEAERKLIGSPLYVSPESAIYASRGEEAAMPDVRADIYSLGACFYHLLTKTPPFQAKTPVATVKARFQGMPRWMREITEVSKDADQLIRDMIRPDPAKRPESMLEVIGRLDVILSNLAPLAGDANDVKRLQLASVATDEISPETPESTDSTNVEGEQSFDASDRSFSVALASASADRASTETSHVLKPATTISEVSVETEMTPWEMEQMAEDSELSQSALTSLASAANEAEEGWRYASYKSARPKQSARQSSATSRQVSRKSGKQSARQSARHRSGSVPRSFIDSNKGRRQSHLLILIVVTCAVIGSLTAVLLATMMSRDKLGGTAASESGLRVEDVNMDSMDVADQ